MQTAANSCYTQLRTLRPHNYRCRIETRRRARVSSCAVKGHDGESIGVDVEYLHFAVVDAAGALKAEQSVAAWVAVVDEEGGLLLKTFVRLDLPQQPIRWLGGVRLDEVDTAPPTQEVTQAILQLAQEDGGRLVVGHGIPKDLKALGLRGTPLGTTPPTTVLLGHEEAPSVVFYDTMTYPEFQGKGGTARSLKRLVADHLGLKIHASSSSNSNTAGRQAGGRGRAGTTGGRGGRTGMTTHSFERHDPEEDARVAMALYQDIVRPKLVTDYGTLVALLTQREMRRMEQRRQQQALVGDDSA